MNEDPHEICAVNRSLGVALTDGGQIVNVVTWLDSDGDECSPLDGVVCVAERPDGKFATVDLRDFDEAAVS